MNKYLLLAMAVFAISPLALAAPVANDTTIKKTLEQTKDQAEQSNSGFRISVSKPALNLSLTESGQSTSYGALTDLVGFSAGYASLPIQRLGWTANITNIIGLGSDFGNLIRFDGNLAYATGSVASLKAGINFSNLSSSMISTKAAVGFQIGVGFEATKNLGVDLNYVSMNQTYDDSRLNESGPELSAHATFRTLGQSKKRWVF